MEQTSSIDLTSNENRHKINKIIRSEKLSTKVVKKLWDIEYYRWGILRNQKLDSDFISDVLENQLMNNKIKNSGKILSYMISYQDLTSKHYSMIDHKKLKKSTILDIWQMEPEKLLENCDVQDLYNVLSDEDIKVKDQTKLIKTTKNFCSKTDRLYDVLEIFLQHKSEQLRFKMIEVLVRDNYIKNEYVNKFRNILSEKEFKTIAALLISRNHCSTGMKAKLLLLK